MLFTDSIHHSIILTEVPKKIISLVPSQTELLYDLGLESEVVGITKFCAEPQKWFLQKDKIGGTKNIQFEKIERLQPDIIFANKEENTKEEILRLQQKFKVWTSDVRFIEDARNLVLHFGKILRRESRAEEILKQIDFSLAQIDSYTSNKTKKTAVYFIWNKPYMSVNTDTFIHAMLARFGFENVFAKHPSRYPVTSIEEIINLQPEVIFLSSEPYPFKEIHKTKLLLHFPKNYQPLIQLVDGMYFSWYGSRPARAHSYFKKNLYPLL